MEMTKPLLFSPKSMAQYKVEAKKSIKSKLTIVAIVFFVICAAFLSLNWITPTLIKLIALSLGGIIIYFAYIEIMNLRQIGSIKLNDELQAINYDESAMNTIAEIQKTRTVCKLDLLLIKDALSKK